MNRVAPLAHYYRPGTRGTFEAARRLEINEYYALNLDFVQSFIDYYEANTRIGYDYVSLIWEIMYTSFKLGYLKGGRAAMNGKFKEPPRRRKGVTND